MLLLFLAILAVVLSTPAIHATLSPSISGHRVLAVTDIPEHSFSMFFDAIKSRGFQLTVSNANQEVKIFEFDELVYDHIVLLANTSSGFSGDITIGNLVEFVNKGGNLIVAGSSSVPELLREFSFEFSADFDDAGTAVFDEAHAIVTAENIPAIYSSMFGRKANAILTPGGASLNHSIHIDPVLFSGVAHRLTGRNPLIIPVLTAHATAYSLDENADNGIVVDHQSPFLGTAINLVSALQARNNARVVFSGSTLLFSDEFAKATVKDTKGKDVSSGNAVFVEHISKWAFKEKRVIEVKSFRHHRQEDPHQRSIYRIMDQMVFEARLSEFYDGQWRPFVANDIQFEAVMLDPYIRTTMVPEKKDHDPVSANHLAFFKLPDQYGVFKFKLEYNRHGLSWIEVVDIVEVRPFRHNEYPRFLMIAYPYYVNAFSMIGGFIIVSMVWLFHRDVEKKDAASKTKKNQ